MNIHDDVLRQQLIELTENGIKYGISAEELVSKQIELINQWKIVTIRSHKLAGTCIKCNEPIPIGGRPIDNGYTSVLCKECSK